MTPAQVANPTAVRNWEDVRKAFVEAEERPTYSALAERFSIPPTTVGNVAADQGWVLMRKRYLESQLVASDAASVVLAASRCERLLSEEFRDVVLTLLQGLKQEIGQLDEIKGKGKRLGAIQTASFALVNCGNALKAAGIVGLPKGLTDRMKDLDDGNAGPGWSKGLLNAINVTLNVAGKEQSQQVETTVEHKTG